MSALKLRTRRFVGLTIVSWIIGPCPSIALDDGMVVRLWRYDFAKSLMIESRFVINAGSPVEEHPSTNYGVLRAEHIRPDAEGYEQLLARIRSQRDPIPEGELSTAIEAVNAAKSYGDLPENRVIASPDGKYIVLAPQFSRPVIVNTLTLETERLFDRSDPLWIPMAFFGLAGPCICPVRGGRSDIHL